MNFLKLSTLIFTITFLVACSNPNKYTTVDIHGWIREIDETGERYLVTDSEWNETWVDVSGIKNKQRLRLNTEVNVWLEDGSAREPVAKDMEPIPK